MNKKLQSEKEKLREEYELLAKMRNEYKELLKKNEMSGNSGMVGKTDKFKAGRTKTVANPNNPNQVNAVKSPSDTTIYAPALARSPANESGPVTKSVIQ